MNFHFNHSDETGIYSEVPLYKAKIMGTINRSGCYWAGVDLEDIPDLSKTCSIYAPRINDSTIIIDTSNDVVRDPGEGSFIYNNVEAPIVDVVVDTNIQRSTFIVNSVNGYGNPNIVITASDGGSLSNMLNWNGSKYVIAGGAFVQIPDSVAAVGNLPVLSSNLKGKTIFVDSLGYPVYWNGTAWVDATGTVV